MSAAQHPYTVLLQYPDWMCEDDPETYLAEVDAEHPQAALKQARRLALESNSLTDETTGECEINPLDFALVMCVPGHSFITWRDEHDLPDNRLEELSR